MAVSGWQDVITGRLRHGPLRTVPGVEFRHGRFLVGFSEWLSVQRAELSATPKLRHREKPPMALWRMQLHPADAGSGTRHAVESLAAGFIGLGFRTDPGDLTLVTDPTAIPLNQRDYLDFARRMAVADKVLIIAHHYPLALATVASDYNYIRKPVPELGVWFRHFRRVGEVKYYSDWVTNVSDWQRLVMTDTISILNDPGGQSYQLIQAWP